MIRNIFAAFLIATALAFTAIAQDSKPRPTGDELKALYEKHRSDFDYLLGDWEFTSESKDYGKGRGFWSAVRIAEGAQILDEYRVVSDEGETWYASSTIR